MFEIKVKGLKEMQAAVDDLIKHRIPKFTAIALTETAKGLVEFTKKEMQSRFHRPTRWTMGGLYYMSATTNGRGAHVWFKDESAIPDKAGHPGKNPGTPASEYLWPQVHGGERRDKRYEAALRRFGVLPGGWYTVPGKGVKLDRHGNIPAGTIIEILTGIGALVGMSDTKFYGILGGYKRRKKTTANFFVVKHRQHGGLRPGIWQRVPSARGIYDGPVAKQRGKTKGDHYYKGIGKLSTNLIMARGVKPILMFVKAPRYEVRLPFYDISERFVDAEFPKIFNRLANETLAYWQAKGAGR